MRNRIILIGGLFVSCFFATNIHAAEILDLDMALKNTYRACVGIDEKLSDYKVLAGINTAVQAVGTGLGTGATAVGIVKASTDKKMERNEKILNVEKLTDEEKTEIVAKFKDLIEKLKTKAEKEKFEAQLKEQEKKSKNLGNWRTGLMAGATVTNVTGAILASQSGANKEIPEMIKDCLAKVDDLKMSIGQARMEGKDVTEAQQILASCREYNTVDVSAVSKRAKGAMISSVVGATTGATGTIISGVANSDNIRQNNTKQGKKKEKDLNTASNVLAGATTVASAVSTVFSGTQIAAIKRIAKVAANCEGALK